MRMRYRFSSVLKSNDGDFCIRSTENSSALDAPAAAPEANSLLGSRHFQFLGKCHLILMPPLELQNVHSFTEKFGRKETSLTSFVSKSIH